MGWGWGGGGVAMAMGVGLGGGGYRAWQHGSCWVERWGGDGWMV